MPRSVPPVVPAGRMRDRAQPTLAVAPGVELGPWNAADADAVIAAFADPAIRHWHMRRIDDRDEALAWIGAWADRWTAEIDAGWAIRDAGSGTVMGQVALRTLHLGFGVGQVTYWVRPKWRGRGVATTAASAIAAWGFDELGLHRIEIHHAVGNLASCRVAERLGFELEGTARSALLHEDGWHDMHVHARVERGVRTE